MQNRAQIVQQLKVLASHASQLGNKELLEEIREELETVKPVEASQKLLERLQRRVLDDEMAGG